MQLPDQQVYGLMARMESPEALIDAARRVHQEGYRQFDAYTPFPVEGLARAMGVGPRRLPLVVLLGGIVGMLGGFFLQWYSIVVDYPINVGGRPYNSWPSFLIITFELGVLGAALAAVLGMILANGLPLPYHPVFNAPGFERASQDGFFLCIEAGDPLYDREKTEQLLRAVGAQEVNVVAP